LRAVAEAISHPILRGAHTGAGSAAGARHILEAARALSGRRSFFQQAAPGAVCFLPGFGSPQTSAPRADPMSGLPGRLAARPTEKRRPDDNK